jgi:hypothetical protein
VPALLASRRGSPDRWLRWLKDQWRQFSEYAAQGRGISEEEVKRAIDFVATASVLPVLGYLAASFVVADFNWMSGMFAWHPVSRFFFLLVAGILVSAGIGTVVHANGGRP